MRVAQMTKLALLLALALVFGYVESLIPFYFGVPGAKLGLANLMTVLVLYAYNARWALGINLLRIILAGFLFGNLFGIIYSLFGALVSFCIMFICKKAGVHIVIASILGGIFHNIAQMMLACVLLGRFSVVYYLPLLLICGVFAGFIIGKLGQILMNRGLL